MIAASRDAGMKPAIIKQVQLTWQFGWDDYNYFVGGAGLVKEYGCWGITESWAGEPLIRIPVYIVLNPFSSL